MASRQSPTPAVSHRAKALSWSRVHAPSPPIPRWRADGCRGSRERATIAPKRDPVSVVKSYLSSPLQWTPSSPSTLHTSRLHHSGCVMVGSVVVLVVAVPSLLRVVVGATVRFWSAGSPQDVRKRSTSANAGKRCLCRWESVSQVSVQVRQEGELSPAYRPAHPHPPGRGIAPGRGPVPRSRRTSRQRFVDHGNTCVEVDRERRGLAWCLVDVEPLALLLGDERAVARLEDVDQLSESSRSRGTERSCAARSVRQVPTRTECRHRAVDHDQERGDPADEQQPSHLFSMARERPGAPAPG